MTRAELERLGPRPDERRHGWAAVQHWLRARDLALGLPHVTAPRAACSFCASMITTVPGDRCASCGRPIPREALSTPEDGRDPGLEHRTLPPSPP